MNGVFHVSCYNEIESCDHSLYEKGTLESNTSNKLYTEGNPKDAKEQQNPLNILMSIKSTGVPPSLLPFSPPSLPPSLPPYNVEYMALFQESS